MHRSGTPLEYSGYTFCCHVADWRTFFVLFIPLHESGMAECTLGKAGTTRRLWGNNTEFSSHKSPLSTVTCNPTAPAPHTAVLTSERRTEAPLWIPLTTAASPQKAQVIKNGILYFLWYQFSKSACRGVVLCSRARTYICVCVYVCVQELTRTLHTHMGTVWRRLLDVNPEGPGRLSLHRRQISRFCQKLRFSDTVPPSPCSAAAPITQHTHTQPYLIRQNKKNRQNIDVR